MPSGFGSSLQKSALSGSGLPGRLLLGASGQLESHTSVKEAWFTFIEFDEPQASLGLSWDTGNNSLITVNPQRGPLQDYTMKKKENEGPGCTLQGRGHDGRYSLRALLQGLCLEGPCSSALASHLHSCGRLHGALGVGVNSNPGQPVGQGGDPSLWPCQSRGGLASGHLWSLSQSNLMLPCSTASLAFLISRTPPRESHGSSLFFMGSWAQPPLLCV